MTDCPKPRRLASGEMTCLACGRIWDYDDTPPTCEGAPSPAEKARQAVADIRQVLQTRD